MRNTVVLLFILISFSVHAQMILREADSLSKHYAAKADSFLVGDTSLHSFYTINLYGVSIYASAEDKRNEKPEMRIFWSELPIYKRVLLNETRELSMNAVLHKGGRPFRPGVLKQYGEPVEVEHVSFHPPQKPLSGYRIAIDPGHIAHDTLTGKLEQKFISMNVPQGRDSLHIAFAEGQLTWQTAVMLAARLRNAGAEVILTRNGLDLTAFGKTFEQWKREDYPRVLDSLLIAEPENQNYKDLKSGKMKEDRSIFRFVFRDLEFRKRAEIINAFHPHLSIMIHYNVDETNAPWSRPTTKNYCMLFVPGAFQAGELDDSEKRFDFLRLLLMDDIEESINACSYVGEQFTKHLAVPLAKSSDAAYLSSSCRYAGKAGIYARNLSMTRLIHGTIVFGETLYQDNVNEAKQLSQMKSVDSVSGQRASSRTIEVAEAYFEGVVQWAFSYDSGE